MYKQLNRGGGTGGLGGWGGREGGGSTSSAVTRQFSLATHVKTDSIHMYTCSLPELPHPLEVRWRAASVVKQFIGLTDPQIDAQDLSAVLDQGCCHSRQVAQLHQIVLQTFKLHLSRLSDSSYNTGQGY